MGDSPQAVAKVEMLIRRPAGEVFDAFVNPETLSKFWLSKSSGPLRLGETVQWEFRVPGATVETTATLFEPDQHLKVNWSDGSTVEWTFTDWEGEGTIVEIVNSGYKENPMETALESTQGFTIVLCDLKLFLESGKENNLTADKAELIQFRMKDGG